MGTLRGTSKFLALLLGVQTVCLGIGIWVQHRFEEWSLRQSVVRSAALHLADNARHIVADLDKEAFSQELSAHTSGDALRHILAMTADKLAAGIVVDNNNRVIATGTPDGDVHIPASPRDSLVFNPIKGVGEAPSDVALVEFSQADGAQLAAVIPIPGLRQKLVMHIPKARAIATADTYASAQMTVRWLTMAWIVAVMSVAFYTMMARYLGHVTRERRRSGGRYLRHGDAVVRTRDAVIFGLAKLAESRDPDTGDHLERISTYSKLLAKVAQSDPRFADQITPVFVRNIGLSSALHDIGKVGIQDRVLLKRGPLSLEERVHMQSHVAIGGQCLRDIERRLGGSNFLQMAREIAVSHHECWDGSGYPDGLCGKGIPLAARIVAIADFYDALSMRRVYKEAFPHTKCKQMIIEESGRRFDPDLVEIWLTIEAKFAAIAERFCQVQEASDGDKESKAQQAELQWEPGPVSASR